MDKIRILIADDHGVLREGTRNLLDAEPDMEVVAEAEDGLQAIEQAEATDPDVCIMDVAMPRLDGIEATRRIKAAGHKCAVLVLSAYDDDQFVFSLLAAGASGYLLKSVRGRELVEAVRAVHAGESVLHPAIARKVLSRFVPTISPEPAARPKQDVLTDREMDVLRLAARGLSNRDIARELALSERTVQGHFGHILERMHASSRTEAVVQALKEGWVTLSRTS